MWWKMLESKDNGAVAVSVLKAQAVLVLREALPGERGDEPPVQSDESSLSLPSIPTNGREGKQGELAQREPGKGVFQLWLPLQVSALDIGEFCLNPQGTAVAAGRSMYICDGFGGFS